MQAKTKASELYRKPMLAAVAAVVCAGVFAADVKPTREPQRCRLETSDIVCEGQGGNIAPKTTEFNEHPTSNPAGTVPAESLAKIRCRTPS